MAKLGINTGSSANDNTGDSLIVGAIKINSNFNEIYSYLGAGSTDTLSVPIWTSNESGISTLRNVGIGTTANSSHTLTVNGDARIGINTSNGVVLTSPNGTQYRLIVDDSGNLSTVST